MKKLNLSAVTTTIGFPQKSGSLTHIQSAYQEAIASAVKSILFGSLYDATKAYILHGCVATGTDPGARTISAGAIFYNGEVYQVDAASFTTTGLQVAVGTIATTYYADTSADPVQFTDGITRNVHEIRKIVFAAGLSGSGDFNFSDAVDLRYKPQGCIGQVIMWKIPSGVLSDYFTAGLGTHQLTEGWAIADGANGTDNWAGKFPVGYSSGETEFDTVGETGGAKTVTLAANEQGYIAAKAKNDDISGGGQTVMAVLNLNGTDVPLDGAGNQAGYGTTVNIPLTAASNAHNNLPPYRTALFIQRIA